MQAEKCFPLDLKGIWAMVDADGNKVLVRYSKDSSSQLLYVYDKQAGKLTPVDDKANSQKAFLFGNQVYWVSEGDDICRNKTCILSKVLNDRGVKRLNLPKNLKDFDDVRFSPTGTNLVVQESRNGIDTLRVFWLTSGRIIKETS